MNVRSAKTGAFDPKIIGVMTDLFEQQQKKPTA